MFPSWNTMADVIDNMDAHVQLTMRDAVTTVTAFTVAGNAHQDEHIIPGARSYVVQAARRIEVLTAGLKVADGCVLAAAALMYLCKRGLRAKLDEVVPELPDPFYTELADPLYAELGGDRTARIAETAYAFNGVFPDGSTARRDQQAADRRREYVRDYEEWLDTLGEDPAALLVVLADNYALGDVLELIDPRDARNLYCETKYDLLPLAEGDAEVNELFGPWLKLYADFEGHQPPPEAG